MKIDPGMSDLEVIGRLLISIRRLLWLLVALSVFILLTGCSRPPADRNQMQNEYDSYRLCMQMAARTNCTMTPQDFMRYYELKQALEQEHDRPGDESNP